jgi:hypothetical protein
VALVLLAAVLTTTRSGVGVAPAPGQTVVLTAASPAEWSLSTEHPRLSRLRVWVAQPAPVVGRLTVALSDVALPSFALARAEAHLSAAGPDGALDLSFDPLRAGLSPHVTTTTLLVRLNFEGEAGARVALRGAGEARVAFEPGYEARPFDAIWPISAMAQGRTGALGWPPFYALLAYAFLVMLVHAVLLAVRAESPFR